MSFAADRCDLSLNQSVAGFIRETGGWIGRTLQK
jgi:hypothetical protein